MALSQADQSDDTSKNIGGWQTLSSEEVYKTPWIRVRRDEVTNHRGNPLTYSVIEIPGPSVFIIAINPEGKILLERNYRYSVNRKLWEIPAGFSDGQPLLEAAKRELLEETGYASDDWTELGIYYQAVGIGNLPIALFLARNVRQESQDLDKDEALLENRFMSFSEIESMIKSEDSEMLNAAELGLLYIAKIRGL